MNKKETIAAKLTIFLLGIQLGLGLFVQGATVRVIRGWSLLVPFLACVQTNLSDFPIIISITSMNG